MRSRALEGGKLVHMAVPRLAHHEPFSLLDPDTLVVTTVQLLPAGAIPSSGHDVAVDLIVMPELTGAELAAIPILQRLRSDHGATGH